MITRDNLPQLLDLLGFVRGSGSAGDVRTRHFEQKDGAQCDVRVDVGQEKILFTDAGITVNDETTSNFSKDENFVVLECVCRLLEKGYAPRDLEIEPRWKLGHESKSSGKADIWIRKEKENGEKESLLIIECKTYGEKFDEEWGNMQTDGGQLFSYLQQQAETKFLCLYESDVVFGENGASKIKYNYRLLNMQDDEDFIKKKQQKHRGERIRTYADSKNVITRFTTWVATYDRTSLTAGLFEEDVPPYAIGKTRYRAQDLIEVDADEIRKKYNEYALILRQHNIGTGENAFDKLVNLFLAKIVDEREHSDDLFFYWKGELCDDDYKLQDRLQNLYTKGMADFLHQDMVYISEEDIENTFAKFKTDPDSVKKQVKEYFRKLKFYSNNEFSFISVHNKELFEKNAVILRKVVQMLQNIKLKTNNGTNENQFLGDLFEGFLTKGVKQNEGQFFTPMPIVRFIVSSLPLENMILQNKNLQCIDYACGAAHFLTEYANQIRNIIKKNHLDIALDDVWKNITGIEKQDRLAKVAKVSAFMYGLDAMNIVCCDALQQSSEIKHGFYDLLITNPPFSVKGFLETLSNFDRNNYSLFDGSLNITKNKAIETFFVERAAQIVKAGGIAAIILPVSVLSKNGLFMRIREIIIENFSIIAVAKFPQGTFGKTGTNVVVLFLRRKETLIPDREHFRNRIQNWFSGAKENDVLNSIYADKDTLISAYCTHCGFDFQDYVRFMKKELTPSFLNHGTIKVYKNAFDGNSTLKDVNEKAKSIQKAFMQKTDDEKQQIGNSLFCDFACEIEKEKLYYFVLCYTQNSDVIVIDSPQKSAAERKAFLGYEWSDRNGDEGIKYVKASSVKKATRIADDEDSEDDTLEQIRDIRSIKTPLFNSSDGNDESKINTLIRDNFLGKGIFIPDGLKPFVSKYHLYDMIDFDAVSFNKAIKTSAAVRAQVEDRGTSSKWEKVRLRDYIHENEKSKFQVASAKDNETGAYPFFTSGNNIYRTDDFIVDGGNIYLSTGGNAVIKFYNGKASYSTDTWCIKSKDENAILTYYMFEYLEQMTQTINDFYFKGAGLKHLQKQDFKNIYIPLPPLPVQQRIVKECEAIDAERREAEAAAEGGKSEIARLFEGVEGERKTYKLSDSNDFDVSIGRRVLESEFVAGGKFPVYSANVLSPFGTLDKSIISDFSVPSVLWGIDGDWMVNYIPENTPFMPTDHCGMLRVKNKEINAKFIVPLLQEAGAAARFSRVNRASIERIKSLALSLPPREVQDAIISQLNGIEARIARAREVIAGAQGRRRAVLERELL